MTAALITYPTAPTARRNPAKTGGNKPTGKRSGGGVGARCVYCGKMLKGKHSMTCGPSCKTSLSRLKRRLADSACVEAWGWKEGEGEALIVKYGLPQVERALNMRGIVWKPEQMAWVWAKEVAA